MSAMGMTIPVDRTHKRRFRGGCAALAGLRLALPMIAAVAWWLAATPASAQQQPEARPGAVSRSGEGAAPRGGDLAARNQLLIVGSTTLGEITEAIIKRLTDAYVMPRPTIRLDGTRTGIAAFCAGIGPEYPDIVAATDRMSRGEFETCVENEVLDVIEVSIGYSAVVIVTKKGDQVFNLTPRMVYYGLAENIPIKGEFKANDNKSWNQTDKDAADLPIQVIIPTKGLGVRRFFDDNFMQGGCRHVKEIDAIFSAVERVPLCVRVRDDGPVSEVAEEQVVDALIKAPRGTLAVVGWTVYLDNKDKLETLPIKGVQPSHENIDNDSYAMSSTLHYYFKRAHMRAKYGGRGVVQGIREFMDEIVKDEAFGEGGYLEKVGMVALGEQDQRVQKKTVRRLKRFEP